ncbi:MAG TPA: hypothetical protein VKP61_00645 [Candidatus Acidoferrum sp.]|nr:hypothetical protein [Candidatus Acidoferrum sp.]
MPSASHKVSTMDNEMKEALDAMEMRILDRIEATETRLLSAFHGWSTTMELRTKSLPATDQRLAVVEDRISAVERKLLERGM